jgi:hypothetical protein
MPGLVSFTGVPHATGREGFKPAALKSISTVTLGALNILISLLGRESPQDLV